MMLDGMREEDETHSCVAGSPADLDRPRLVAIWKGGATTLLLPERGRVLVGRSASCELRIDDGSVSREHAVLCIGQAGQPCTLQDLGSSNGTRVAGQLIEPGRSAAFTPGALAQLGEAMLLLQQRPAEPLPLGPSLSALEPLARADDPMGEVHRLADLVASGDISVILRGETGVGKELLAGRIHEHSRRADKPFLKLNCAAFSESMVEAELFGYERGAFTGAVQPKAGLLETAHGGTVLLDELGELSLAMQAKLLRAIGNREVYRVGATKPRPIDVRFLAATHRDLEPMIERGEFRADLYFRLNGISLHLPPLRARAAEIVPLAERFAREASQTTGASCPGLSSAAREQLSLYAWPGNIRELRSVVERAVLLCRGSLIEPEHLGLSAAPAARAPARVDTPPAPPAEGRPLRDAMQDLERERILRALNDCGGNQTRAARQLGISRRALLHRLDAYAFPRPRKPLDGVPHE
jgi:two-component system response regulator AtoC